MINKNNFKKLIYEKDSLPPCAQLMGARIVNITDDPTHITVDYKGIESFTNPFGTIQGGFLTAMLDDAMGLALLSTLEHDQIAPSIDLNVKFHHPCKVGLIKAFATIELRKRNIAFIRGELYQNNIKIADSSSTALIKRI